MFAPAASTVIRQFSKSFSTSFMSASSNRVYIQRRGYEIECSLLRVEIRNAYLLRVDLRCEDVRMKFEILQILLDFDF